MSPNSLSFRSANILETTTSVSKGPEKETFITSPLSSPIDVLKDVRAYERERQRVKKAAELVKAKERKERGTVAGRNNWGPWGDKSKTSVARSGKTSWFGGKGLWDSENEKGEKGHLEVERHTTPIRATLKEDTFEGEVKLADLMTARKSRKNKEGDFEVIPLPRSVIVLDDFTVHDMDVDEPWEYVDGDDGEKVDGPSYAEIVSSAK